MIDGRQFRNTIGLFATGVTVIISGEGADLHAMTANAVMSLSLDPMLLIVGVHKKAKLAALLQAGQGFSVNILSQEQKDLSNYFAGGWRETELPAFHFLPWSGAPRLEGCVAAVGCDLEQLLEGGDHWIAVGRVVALYQADDTNQPLLFYGGQYHELATQTEYVTPVNWDFEW